VCKGLTKGFKIMQGIFTSLQLDNPFVQQTLFAFASLALGLFGMVLGQRVASQGKLCLLFGVGVGVFTMWLLTTSYALLAPGFAGVFIFAFVASGGLMKLAAVGSPSSGGAKKPASPTPPPAGGGTPPRA
jgi:hypothetical protein